MATFPKASVDLEGQPTHQARVVEFKGNCDFGDGIGRLQVGDRKGRRREASGT
ncbi:MAG: hypothetical protein V5A91_07905 [Candidatus Accumulibacter necessarius]|uniref:hypothetical protein n=1 Tax=Candidatus Accumulibacter necessarius TaxID=2954386 RepID=UPI002FC35EBF